MAEFTPTGVRSSASRAGLARLAARVEGLSDAEIRKADKRALVSVRRRFEPAVKRVIRAQYNVPARELNGKFRVVTGTAEGGEYLELSASSKRVPLIAFGARWGGRRTKGARATVMRGGTRIYPSSFIATIGGRKEMLIRQFSADSNSPSGRSPRNKLQLLRGPSPADMARGIDNVNARRIAGEMTTFRTTELMRLLGLARKGKL